VVAAENAPGVKAVNDHLSWVEAISGMVLYPRGEDPAQMKVSSTLSAGIAVWEKS
jgi:hypothetical protein